MTLPIKTGVDDALAVVAYLKSKPTGATLAEAKAVIDNRVLDGRKLNAYQVWGLVEQEGEKYKLTDRGRRLARDPESSPQIFREVINSIPTYRSAIEWAYHQKFDTISVDDLAANWHAHHREALGTDADGSIKGAVTCFFNVADGAGLGKYVVGRSGGMTRLEVYSAQLKPLVEAGPSDPPWQKQSTEEHDSEEESDSDDVEPSAPAAPVVPAELPAPEAESVRVFISHGKNMDVVDQVKTVLDLADIKWEVAVEEESAAIPVPDKVFGAMRSCNAGIICVSGEEVSGTEGEYTLNQNVLIEIGAAFVLYDRRVVLLWDKRIPVPSNLQGLYRCEFDGDELSWSAGTKLMKAIQGFKKS
ncbi:TIR domain-containing protein [Microbacterium allomyrinae]|uniref:Nucleotide-binding protein n=1 Tax=Microbacterium allomyrinae TaxID=2830666 RepID=A0A9X1LU13_9MICO|nr:TIR domain-containing protein [Microbacterium allomyrinae]MCC2031846.1 nucleotide-binding protein [Microbacterium allomyrinae]